jgi:hypothetical protein
MPSFEERACQDFANAIVKQAVDDYRNALKGKGYNGKKPEKIIKEIEKFFLSDYFKLLTKVKGEYLIEQLNKEHIENERSKHEGNTDTSDTQPD